MMKAVQSPDDLPRQFQADAVRFYLRVILPGLDALEVHATLETGVTDDINVFLDRCAAQVDNYTANEAAKAFALTTDAIFQRQLSRWARACLGAKGGGAYQTLLFQCAKLGAIDLTATGMAGDLNEMHVAANVVRHGEGASCEALKGIAPHLWNPDQTDYFDLSPGPVPLSENLRIGAADLRRYVRAVARFWGHADPLPGADRDPIF